MTGEIDFDEYLDNTVKIVYKDGDQTRAMTGVVVEVGIRFVKVNLNGDNISLSKDVIDKIDPKAGGGS